MLKTLQLNWHVVRMPLGEPEESAYRLVCSFASNRRDIRNVAIDDLQEGAVAVVAENVKRLRLDRRRVHGLPQQVRPLQLRVGRLLGFLGHRLDGRRAIDGLLGAGDVRQPVNRQSICDDIFKGGRGLLRSQWGPKGRGLFPLLLLGPVEHVGRFDLGSGGSAGGDAEKKTIRWISKKQPS